MHPLGAHLANPDPAVAVLGLTTLAPEVRRSPLMRHVTEVGCQLFSYGWMKPGQVMDHTAFWGGRSSCKRSLLVRHGVFHPDFRFGCEDIELGWRLRRFGLKLQACHGGRHALLEIVQHGVEQGEGLALVLVQRIALAVGA